MTPEGYTGKYLNIDLSTGAITTPAVTEEFADKFVGGRGFGVKLVWDNLQKTLEEKGAMDPLGPDNLLVIAPGPLTGLYIPGAGKTSIVSISPATGVYGDSNVGGMIGAELRQAGYEAVALRGKARELSYIMIDEDGVSIVPAPHLKGKKSLEAEGMIKEEHGDHSLKIMVIGPGGENLVRFACINSDWGRNAGRCGMGAVLGSKNIKAIAVRGSQDLPVHDIQSLKAFSDRGFKVLRKHPLFEFWQEQGLMSVIDYVNEAGVMPTYNFREGQFKNANKINGETMLSKYKIGDSACFGCPMACSNITLVKDGPYKGAVVEGPEYESACIFGSNLGVANFAFLVKANMECDELGVDTISAGNLIGVLIEGQEKGILSKDDLDGLSLTWGDEKGILEALKKIARREGFGDILALGTNGVIEHWPDLAPIISHVKGLEQSAYDGRVAVSMALAYGTSDIGAHHARAWTLAKEIEMGEDWSNKERAETVIYHQTIRPLFDMLGVCRLQWIELGFDERIYANFYQAVTGKNYSLEDLLERSRHIYDITRMINIKLGATKEHDAPPERMFTTPMTTGPHAGKTVDRDAFEELLQMYYEMRGWDKNGVPQNVNI